MEYEEFLKNHAEMFHWYHLYNNEVNIVLWALFSNVWTLVVLVEPPKRCWTWVANISGRSTDLHWILDYNHIYYYYLHIADGDIFKYSTTIACVDVEELKKTLHKICLTYLSWINTFNTTGGKMDVIQLTNHIVFINLDDRWETVENGKQEHCMRWY